MRQLTSEEAISFATNGAWKSMDARTRALFQLQQDKLCMPFDEFHKSVEDCLGRPVFTHEFGLNKDGLLAEVIGEKRPPSFEDVLSLVPNSTVIVMGK